MACDNTTPDAGLTDTCISIAHGTLPQWWLSPAITLNGVSAGAVAQAPPAHNVVNVTFHRAGTDCTLPAGTSAVLVTVYSCVPGLAMNPADPSKVMQLDTKAIALASVAPGANSSLSGAGQTIDWVAGTDPSQPDGPGHKCLVAIAYPDSETADSSCFHQAGGPGVADQHYAQLNIAIEPVPLHPRRPWGFGTFTINPDHVAAAPATLRAEADLDPDQRVIDLLSPALNATPGFRRITSRAPQGFALQLPDFPNAVIRDRTRWGCLGLLFWILSLFGIKFNFKPSYEADVRLNPGQIATINFTADVSSSNPGDAHIFHLTHARSDGRVIGGLTVVAVVQ
jgi:hypothetical protein